MLDQITKFIAVEQLYPASSFPIIKDVLHFTYVENTGAAFGILKDHRWIFMVLSTVMIAVMLFLMFKFKKYMHPILLVGLSFTIGGGIGNMIDRIFLGYVVDFIDFTLIDFPSFNVADSFICIGVGLMVLDILLGKSNIPFLDKKEEKETEDIITGETTDDETDSR